MDLEQISDFQRFWFVFLIIGFLIAKLLKIFMHNLNVFVLQ